MKHSYTQHIFNGLTKKYGINGWKLEILNRNQTEKYSHYGLTWDNSEYAQCVYVAKTIAITSKQLVLLTKPQIRDVLIHEIAHILTPPNSLGLKGSRKIHPHHGHTKQWKQEAVRMGGTGQTYYLNLPQTNQFRYYAVCDSPSRTKHVMLTSDRSLYETTKNQKQLFCVKCASVNNIEVKMSIFGNLFWDKNETFDKEEWYSLDIITQ